MHVREGGGKSEETFLTFSFSQDLVETVGFIDWLLNRGNERTPEGCEWKYGIVRGLLQENEGIRNLLDPIQWRDLSAYEKQGIHYVPAEPKVLVAEKTE